MEQRIDPDFNVVMNGEWTSVPKGSILREKAPNVEILAHRVKKNEALERITSYLNIIEKDPEKFYDALYSNSIERAVCCLNLPYFGDAVRSFSNEYGDTFQAGFLGTIDTMLNESATELGALYSSGKAVMTDKMTSALAGLHGAGGDGFKEKISNFKKSYNETSRNVSSSPGSYIETPKLYQYANNDSPLTVDFVLSNTINAESHKTNKKVIDKLIRLNRPKRKNSIEMEPPHIYTVRVPGLRYIKWAYCSSMDIRLLGTRRKIDDMIVPEGYMISMSFNSLTTEVSNFMDYVGYGINEDYDIYDNSSYDDSSSYDVYDDPKYGGRGVYA